MRSFCKRNELLWLARGESESLVVHLYYDIDRADNVEIISFHAVLGKRVSICFKLDKS